MTEFRTILVANRGEIAVRVIRTVRDMGIRSVAVYSDADVEARHVVEADVAVALGGAAARDSYLNIDKIIDAARRTGADAIHPGYGFLSENPAFARSCADAGIVFIGPPVAAVELMADKIAAKNTVTTHGVPTIPGTTGSALSDDELIAAAANMEFPVLVKPSAGGGGKGMRRVDDPALLPEALVGARREASAAFGDDTLLLEQFVTRPRHIEVQVLADSYGNVVHLGERECSLQRRHQKVIEEAPSALLDDLTRTRIGAAACATARSVDYVGAGTVEFLVAGDRPDEFFFMEMNTRLQVEHPVTELVTGIDLVEWQIRIAQGNKLGMSQEDVRLVGHAMEARVYAEDPARGFLPTGGTVLALTEPASARVDSGLRVGTVVGGDYDPMLSKVIAYGATREAALHGLDRALADTAIIGVTTNIEFLRFLLRDPDVNAGRLDTGLLDRLAPDFVAKPVTDAVFVAAAAYGWVADWRRATDPWQVPSGWRISRPAAAVFPLSAGDRTVEVRLSGSPDDAIVTVDDGAPQSLSIVSAGATLVTVIDGVRCDYHVAERGRHIWLAADSTVHMVGEAPAQQADAAPGHHHGAEIFSPMPGTVISALPSGSQVDAGAALVVVEAMKMEHALTAPTAGTAEIMVAAGDRVAVDQLVARLEVSE